MRSLEDEPSGSSGGCADFGTASDKKSNAIDTELDATNWVYLMTTVYF
ncbi:MAG: hypothetical protein IH600_07360 [Bacteroidetes bacterium]|nr:hypothetical protein [Bacteroidota bacterium]